MGSWPDVSPGLSKLAVSARSLRFAGVRGWLRTVQACMWHVSVREATGCPQNAICLHCLVLPHRAGLAVVVDLFFKPF